MSNKKNLPIKKVADLETMLSSQQERLTSLLPSEISFQAFQTNVIAACSANQNLLTGVSRSSLMMSCFEAATLGVQVNSPLQESWIIPFKGKAKLIIGYRGVSKLLYQSGFVKRVEAHPVYLHDDFDFQYGSDPYIHLKPAKGQRKDRGQLLGVYALVELMTGACLFEYMELDELERIRATSKASNSDAWKNHPVEMHRKSAIIRVCKTVPKSGHRLTLAIDVSSREHSERFEAESKEEIEIINNKLLEATAKNEELLKKNDELEKVKAELIEENAELSDPGDVAPFLNEDTPVSVKSHPANSMHPASTGTIDGEIIDTSTGEIIVEGHSTKGGHVTEAFKGSLSQSARGVAKGVVTDQKPVHTDIDELKARARESVFGKQEETEAQSEIVQNAVNPIDIDASFFDGRPHWLRSRFDSIYKTINEKGLIMPHLDDLQEMSVEEFKALKARIDSDEPTVEEYAAHIEENDSPSNITPLKSPHIDHESEFAKEVAELPDVSIFDRKGFDQSDYADLFDHIFQTKNGEEMFVTNVTRLFVSESDIGSSAFKMQQKPTKTAIQRMRRIFGKRFNGDIDKGKLFISYALQNKLDLSNYSGMDQHITEFKRSLKKAQKTQN